MPFQKIDNRFPLPHISVTFPLQLIEQSVDTATVPVDAIAFPQSGTYRSAFSKLTIWKSTYSILTRTPNHCRFDSGYHNMRYKTRPSSYSGRYTKDPTMSVVQGHCSNLGKSMFLVANSVPPLFCPTLLHYVYQHLPKQLPRP